MVTITDQRWSDWFHLFTALKEHLSPSARHEYFPADSGGLLAGTINLTHDSWETKLEARCEFRFAHSWRCNAPDVWCFEPWLRRDGDWHVYRDGRICWILEKEWQDTLAAISRDHGLLDVSRFAAFWCCRNTRWLLARHQYGSEFGLVQWPSNWPEWRHGDVALADYRKWKRRLLL